MGTLIHQHPTRQAGRQQVEGAGVAVARQAYAAELPQHQQHHKGPGAAQRSARRAMGMLHPVQYNTQVKQAVAAGRNAQAPDVPANALGLPAEPKQHAGKQSLRDQRIAAAQQFFQQKLYARIQ